jgi:Putative prokaryotic signal transducing protein
MITIRTFYNPAEAGFAQSLLEASGIEAALIDENAGTFGMAPMFASRLQVAEEDVDRAVGILDSHVPDAEESKREESKPEEPVVPEHEAPSTLLEGSQGND